MSDENFTDPEVLALLAAGWSVQRRLLYDEEGVEGWEWESPDGETEHVVGVWDDDPPTPVNH